jgi:ABC-type transport system involved in cytochrome bd biosynthesis fused ATPase/permease subunit
MADQVLVLDEGSIVERGTHDELVRGRGRYWQFMEVQRRGLNDSLRTDLGLRPPRYPPGQITITD